MLDLYLIHDSQNSSGRSSELKRIGGMEDELFFLLQAEGIIAPWFDYYSRLRWGSEIVARMLQQLQQQPYGKTLQAERTSFMCILQQAVNAECGLMGLGD
ncbi:hypothetical protein K3G63_03375 [Hymenobacter sp. HSC-4F20]|uniref:hypothetical protein n=1 Tax=Hymenobacter sp. HSC-4F20 TaxID=2864135 RepID=UPI001C72F3EE|nr:hypothetical protein [Hymenobacter sp. HSC-4F20]MBX0289460.1 hypothetical protein [Hymenobacter sp. HSC-4F20]